MKGLRTSPAAVLGGLLLACSGPGGEAETPGGASRLPADCEVVPAALEAARPPASGVVRADGPDFRSTGPASPVPAFQNMSTEVAYVGREECSICHNDIQRTFVHTGMGRAFYPLGPDNAVEDFAEDNSVDLASGLHYRMVERDGRYYQRQFLIDEGGEEVALDEREMVYIIGSGNHSRSYLTVEDGKLYQMPICWYPWKGIWDLCPGYEEHNEHFTREITQPCVFCHNGRMEPLPGPAKNQYRRPFVHGIGCERCHGPGELHVERWSSGEAEPTGDLDPTIVNPRRLPPDRRMHVCFQCHLGDAMETAMPPRDGTTTQDWRPGQLIHEAVIHFRYAEPSPTAFGLSSQADRLFLSRCFQESAGRLECLTCHNPHVPVYRDDRPADFFTSKCLLCHTTEACTGRPESRQATSPPDNCVACHMRQAQPHDHPHTTFTDHWIVRRIDREPRQRSSYELTAMLPELVRSLPAPERLYYLGKAYVRKSLTTGGPEREVLRDLADRHLLKAIRCGHDTAGAWFELGVNRTYMRRWPQAIEALEAAVRRDPGHRDAIFALGQALMETGRPIEAAAVFNRLLDQFPDDSAAMAELGRLEMSFDRPLRALPLYDQAVRAQPLKPSLHANRAMSLAGAGRRDEAIAAIDRATRLDPEEPTYWRYYAQLLAEKGLEGEARRARRQALARSAPHE